jgi:hypothetical protein
VEAGLLLAIGPHFFDWGKFGRRYWQPEANLQPKLQTGWASDLTRPQVIECSTSQWRDWYAERADIARS